MPSTISIMCHYTVKKPIIKAAFFAFEYDVSTILSLKSLRVKRNPYTLKLSLQ